MNIAFVVSRSTDRFEIGVSIRVCILDRLGKPL